MALDLSYIIPIFCRRVFHSHPEVMFKPGPFYMGDGWLGLVFNVTCISWTLFICVIFSLPTIMPVTGENMNYASVRIFANEQVDDFLTLFPIGDYSRRYCLRIVRLFVLRLEGSC